MRSLVDVVRDVGPENSFEVPTIVDQDVVEALVRDRKNSGPSPAGIQIVP